MLGMIVNTRKQQDKKSIGSHNKLTGHDHNMRRT